MARVALAQRSKYMHSNVFENSIDFPLPSMASNSIAGTTSENDAGAGHGFIASDGGGLISASTLIIEGGGRCSVEHAGSASVIDSARTLYNDRYLNDFLQCFVDHANLLIN